MIKLGRPVRVTLLLILAIILVPACDRNGNADAISTPAAVSTAESDTQYKTVERLIKRYVEQPGGRDVAVEINADALEDLVQIAGDDESLSAFRDPLRAAKLFASHIGLSEGARFAILEVSQQPEEGSGLFIAVVQVKGSDLVLQMRMVSEPDEYEQPTLWVLNDYQR